MKSLKKQLENRLNFYKLAYPNIKIQEYSNEDLTKEEDEDFNLQLYMPNYTLNKVINESK